MVNKPEYLDYEKMKDYSVKKKLEIIFTLNTLRIYSLILFVLGFLIGYFFFR